MRIRGLLLLVLLALIPFSAIANEKESTKEILFICSYATDNDFTRSNVSSFLDIFTKLHDGYKYSTEGLNCVSLNDKGRWVNDIGNIMKKHNNASLVVLIGTEAWISYFSLDDPDVKKIPVFCIMGQRYCASFDTKEIPCLYKPEDPFSYIDMLDKMKDFNVQLCYYYDYDLNRDIDLLKNFFPTTKNIAIISDNTINGISHLRQIKSVIKKRLKEINIIFIDGRKINTQQATNLFHYLPEHSVAVLCIWKFDKDDVAYMDNARYSFNKANPNVPVFSLTGTGIGNWAIGGYIPKYRPLGEELGLKASQLLETSDWKGPYIKGYEHQLKLDLNQLKKWRLLDKDIPSKVVYVNPDFSWSDYIKLYKWYFILIAGIFIVLTTGLILVIISNIKIRILRRNLEKKDDMLVNERNELLKYQNELIKARDKADEANRMKSAFVSNMSHEIRTPLNAIVGFSDVLVSSITPTEEQKEYINIINHNTTILLKLISDILDLSRIESQKQVLCYENVDIISSLESTVVSMRPNTHNDVEIIFIHKEDTLTINTDILRLQQVVINLIGNAIKFTEKGSITLSVERKEDDNVIEFSVSDTGCGIPLDKQDHVFERFNKVNEFVQGTGLGLSICEATIKQFGGNIWIDSKYTDGARFIFTIPIDNKQV